MHSCICSQYSYKGWNCFLYFRSANSFLFVASYFLPGYPEIHYLNTAQETREEDRCLTSWNSQWYLRIWWLARCDLSDQVFHNSFYTSCLNHMGMVSFCVSLNEISLWFWNASKGHEGQVLCCAFKEKRKTCPSRPCRLSYSLWNIQNRLWCTYWLNVDPLSAPQVKALKCRSGREQTVFIKIQ